MYYQVYICTTETELNDQLKVKWEGNFKLFTMTTFTDVVGITGSINKSIGHGNWVQRSTKGKQGMPNQGKVDV